MKLHKFFAISLVAVAFSSCQSGEEISAPQEPAINTASGVVVSMESAEMFVSEDQQGSAMSNIPVVLTGEANGAVKVTVKVVADEAAPAVEGENFVVTSKSIIIAEGQKSANVQFYPKGDDEINDARQFVVSIESVEGAQVGAVKSTVVSLKDNESFLPVAYAQLQGIWNCTVTSDDGPFTGEVEIVGVEEGEEGYLSDLSLFGWESWEGINAELKCKISVDGVTGIPSLLIPLGQAYFSANFTGLGFCDMVLVSESGGYLVPAGNLILPCNEDVTKMYIQQSIIGGLYQGGSFSGYVFSWYNDMLLERAQ